ncbi:MAG: GntG family PLP-dependent aldolase [Candidatus Thermoplasmatota archaeon]|nr:GntG family PLP-dependent aldolase [Candidatus Thermoplasmatota archaeon]
MRHWPNDRIDLRSDTVTQPTPAMREAMANAPVGDDVYGEDPTVLELEARVAAMCGMEAALFLPSGTMANAVAVRTHTRPGDEIVLEKEAHIYLYEGGGFAALSGCSVAFVDGDRGRMAPAHVRSAIRKADGSGSHYPDGRLICIENTSNRGGGSCYALEDLDAIAAVGRETGCALHVDGARLMNAVVATGTPAERMLQGWDSVAICLSKGLGAPIGSLLVGGADFIARSHRWRKMFGGGMRQVGIVAAAGLHALDHHVDRMAEDHARARRIAEALARHPRGKVDLEGVETNMVYFGVEGWSGQDTLDHLAAHGIDVLTLNDSTCRMVLHLHVTDEDVEQVLGAIAAIP